MKKEFVLFVGEQCPACKKAEIFLKKEKVEYKEIRVEEAPEYSKALGVLSVPTAFVMQGGSIIKGYAGFQRDRYMELVEMVQ